MNKIKTLLIGLLVAIVVPVTVNAESYTFDDITYELDSDYIVTTKDNIDTTTYIPLEYEKEELLELFNKKEFYLIARNEDNSNLKFKIKNVSSCGNIASDKKGMEECISSSINELKERENTDLVIDNTFTSKNGINYYTLEYFKSGSTFLDVITSYNNIVYTFTLATNYGEDLIVKNAKEIMDSASLKDFKAIKETSKSESESKDNNIEEKKDNKSIIVIGITAAVVIISGISIYIFKIKKKINYKQ